jgi:hypothetical protein
MVRRTLPLARLLGFLVVWGILAGLVGCTHSRPYTLGPVKTADPDDRPTPRPEETQESMYWDRVDMSVFHQLEKPLNLNWAGRTVGMAIGVADADEADNVNVMDEPPNSSWWARRHFYDEMTPRQLAIGPNQHDTTGTAAGPADGPWTVTSGKFQGASRGFQIEDSRGDRYLIKLDHPDWPELMSSAEVISTKIFYGAGYHVPQNTITRFSPDQLRVGADAMVQAGSDRRPMTREDLETLLSPYETGEEETIRGVASKFVDGEPLGPIFFKGTRDGDENDRVRHEQRRELRGLRVIGSWLNDADRRHANTLAAYTDERYVKHYILDMGSTLGANAGAPHRPIHGQAYMIDQRKIPMAILGLGAYRFPWWHYDATPRYTAVGYYRADVFRPGEWVPTYPNPAFEKMTRRDAYWGAKIVMSFSDEDLRAIVETARISNPEAEAHLLDVLQKRRDKIGRYWFDRINPLDRFSVEKNEAPSVAGGSNGASEARSAEATARALLHFDDLAVTGGLETAEARRYTVQVYLDDAPIGARRTVEASRVPLTVDGTALHAVLDDRGRTGPHRRVVRVDLRTRQDGTTSAPTRVYVHVPAADQETARVVGLERQ